MQLTLGRIVHYKLSQYDVDVIDARVPQRLDGEYRRNPVQEGQVFPAMAVAIFGADAVNLRVFLDGFDDYWATSRKQSDEPGAWSWPPRV